jgi:hypothetical protein
MLSLPAFVSSAQAQNEGQSGKQSDDVLRIKTELVQTDVSVFDKQGRFVEGLRPEQFLLTINGKPLPISFFERVSTGSCLSRGPSSNPHGSNQSADRDHKRYVAPALLDGTLSGGLARRAIHFAGDCD